MKLHHCAIGLGLALFAVPSLCLARPMTSDESRCFELGEAVYQAATPREWDDPEPYPVAEYLSERAMIDCLAECSDPLEEGDSDDIYGWENYTCR